jgi:hypothetical protein
MNLEIKASFKEGDLINDISTAIKNHTSYNQEESLDLAKRSVNLLKDYFNRYGNSALYDMLVDFCGEIAISDMKLKNWRSKNAARRSLPLYEPNEK